MLLKEGLDKVQIKRMNNVLNDLDKAHSAIYTAANNVGNIKGVEHFDNMRWRKAIAKVQDALESLTNDFEEEVTDAEIALEDQ